MIYVLSSEIDYAGSSVVTVGESLLPIVEAVHTAVGDSLLIQVFDEGKCVLWCRIEIDRTKGIYDYTGCTYESIMRQLKPYKGHCSGE